MQKQPMSSSGLSASTHPLGYYLIMAVNAFEGLNVGTLRAGTMIVVCLDMLRAVFSARSLTTKLPKPLR